MLPKSSKHYIVPTAEKLEVPVNFVEDVINFYYSELRYRLSEMTHYNIQIENLGSFEIKKKGLHNLKEKYTNVLKKYSKDTESHIAIREDTAKRMEKVIRIEKILDEERARKKQHLKERYG